MTLEEYQRLYETEYKPLEVKLIQYQDMLAECKTAINNLNKMIDETHNKMLEWRKKYYGN